MRFLPILFLLVSVNVYSQKPKVDSLLFEFSKATHDTLKLNILDKVIDLTSSDYALLDKYSNEMKAISTKNIDNSSGVEKKTYQHYHAVSLNNLSFVEENKGNKQGALDLYNSALEIFREIDDLKGEAMVLTNLGYVAKRDGNIPQAIEYYSQALKINRKINSEYGILSSQNNLGLAFFAIGDMNKALQNYLEVLKYSQEVGNKRLEATSYNNIAGVYNTQGEKEHEIEYLKKSIATNETAGMRINSGVTIGNLVTALLPGDVETAKIYGNQLMEIAAETKDNFRLGNAWSVMGRIHLAEKNYALAKQDFAKAHEMFKVVNNKAGVITSATQLGEVSRQMNDISEAIKYHSLALQLATESNLIQHMSAATKGLSEDYKKKNDLKNALVYYEKHIVLRDSLANEANRKATFKQQYKYEYEMKAAADSIKSESEKEILTAQVDQEKAQRYAWIAISVLGLTVASFGFYRFRVKQQVKELQLRNQIARDLHDEVGSAISSISLFAGLAKMKSGRETDDIVTKIETTSRETVDNMSDIVWSIEPTNDRFDNVLKKMTYYGDQLLSSLGIAFNLTCDPNIAKTTFDMSTRKNLYLIFKEALNNAAKYSEATKVDVKLSLDKRKHVFEIVDNGSGFDVDQTTMGNGLRNMKRRAEEMGGQLTTASSVGGTIVRLTF